MRRTFAVIGIVSVIGCSPSGPTPPPPPPPPPAASVAVTGTVWDMAARRVSHVRIEVVSGPEKGAVTFSDDSGNFVIEPKLSPLTQIRASKEGYIDSNQVLGFAGPTAELRFVLTS